MSALPAESELTRLVTRPLSPNRRPFAVDTRATWPIEHAGAGGAELLFVLEKALGYAIRIRNSVLAKPHRIWRAGVCILLSIGNCRQGRRDHNHDESNGAQFTHDVALQFKKPEWQRSLLGFVPHGRVLLVYSMRYGNVRGSLARLSGCIRNVYLFFESALGH
jgi:hypothetical protein